MSNNINFNSNDVCGIVIESGKPIYTNAQEQEVNDLMESLKFEQNKYLQLKIIYDLIEEVISEDNIEKKLKSKIKDIILSENMKQTQTIDNKTLKGKEVSLLGVGNDNSVLTYSESNSLKDLLLAKLSAEIHNPVPREEWPELIESNRALDPIQINAEDKVLLEHINNVAIEQEKYVKNLLNLHELLEEITTTRIVDLPDIMDQKIRKCQVEDKINHLKCVLAQKKFNVDIFMETNCSLKAYKELIQDIKEQQRDCQHEIEHLTELKQKYKQIAGNQYDDILTSYLQYKSIIEKKRILYDSLKN